MVAFSYLVCVWALVIAHAQQACGDVQFLERQEGESVSLPCVLERSHPAPLGMYLKRSWLQPGEVLFMYTKTELTTAKGGDKNRTSASGDPSDHAVNITLSQLTVGDTDRYHCEFVVANEASADLQLPGRTDFFLLVTAGDAGWPVHIDWVQTCVGGSALVPCPPPNGEHGAVDGVILKRRRGDAPVEVLYDSRRHYDDDGGGGGGGGGFSPSHFPKERVRLSAAPGPAGFTHNLSLQQLRLHDGGLYSCQLLQRNRPGGRAGLGRRATFVSVEGQCGCSGTPVLLYAASAAAVSLLFILLCLTFVVFHTKSRRGAKGSSQPPVYEEMARVQDAAPSGPRPPGEKQYRRYSVKKSAADNYYETPSGRLGNPDQE